MIKSLLLKQHYNDPLHRDMIANHTCNFSTRGIAKARVFPEPVLAFTIRSWPAIHFDIVLYCTGNKYLIPLDSSLDTTVLEMAKLENLPASSWGLAGSTAGDSSLAKSSSSDNDDGVDDGEEMTGEVTEIQWNGLSNDRSKMFVF